MKEQKTGALLPLEGSRNTRELGGYGTKDGVFTMPRAFLRSAGINGLTSADCAYLRDYGVKCVIDLRSETEALEKPDCEIEGASHASYPMLDHIQSDGFHGALPESLYEMYRGLLEGSMGVFAAVLREMLKSTGCVLFHCTAGKDRTGLVSMLLLDLAGVPEEDIIRDYAVTERYLADTLAETKARLREKGIAVPPHILSSSPETMRDTLAFLRGKYGDAQAYLLCAGLDEEEITRLRARLR